MGDEVANREEAAEAGMDYADMMKVHEIATKHLDIFGHPEDESDSANAMRALFGLEEEETERSMLGGKGFKGMLGSKTVYLSRSALPKDVDNPKKLRTLSSRMQNAFNELLDKHCVTNELDNGGEIMKPRIEGPKIRMEVNFGGCAATRVSSPTPRRPAASLAPTRRGPSTPVLTAPRSSSPSPRARRSPS